MSHSSTARAWSYNNDAANPKIGHYTECLSIRDEPVQKPKPYEVLVRVRAVSLNYRDLAIPLGQYPVAAPERLIPCSDMAGEIVVVGEDVKRWKVGDRVCANFSPDQTHGDPTRDTVKSAQGGASQGVLTEYKIFAPHGLVEIPVHLSFEEAATLPCAALTAYNSLMGPVPLKSGDTVLVQGTGGVSIFGLQFAVASGAEVIVTSSSDEKLKLAKRLGAKHIINYRKTPEWDEEALRLTGGRGMDHVLEIGGMGTLAKSINCARMGGWVHLIGFLAGEKAVDIILPCLSKAVSLRGITIGSVKQFEDMNRLLDANPKIKPVVDRVFAFEEAVAAFTYLQSQSHVGKVVIRVGKEHRAKL